MKEPILYKILKPLIVIIIKVFYHPVVIGKENIPKRGRIVLAGNHTNIKDCLLIMAETKRVVHFLAKDDLTKGIKGLLFNNMGIIPVNRKIHDKEALLKAIEVLKNDKVIGIFPEGTINRTNDYILPFKIGAVKMAYDTNSQIILFTITGKYNIFKNNLKITFNKPYNIRNDNLDVENLKLMNIMINNLKEAKNEISK